MLVFLARKSSELAEARCELRDEHKFFELRACDCDRPPQARQIIVVSTPDFLDHSMNAKAFEHARNLRAVFVREAFANGLVGNTADAIFAADKRLHEVLIFGLRTD